MTIKIISVSDLHIGNSRVPSLKTVESLYKHLFPKLKMADLLCISGDVTDRELSFGSFSSRLLMNLFMDIFSLASKKNMPIAMVRGTISHDRKNLDTIQAFHKKNGYKNSLYYSDQLDVKYIKELDLSIGYMPDNLPFKTSKEVISRFRKILMKKKMTHVDYLLLHGYFRHLVPENAIIKDIVYDEKDFSFVKKHILAGHVHSPLSYKKVLMNGSFDRLAHGEEHAKGFLYIEDEGDRVITRFIKNPDATRFLTYMPVSKNISDIDKFIKEKSPEHLRIRHNDPVLRSALIRHVSRTYSDIRVTSIGKRVKRPETQKIKNIILKPITDENIPDMILDYLKDESHSLNKEKIIEYL